MNDRPVPLPVPVSAAHLMVADLPARETILDPLLARGSLALLYGPRGLGKTFVALAIARAVAAGDGFLKWQAPRPQRVLYLDGEMPAVEMQQRLRTMGAPPPALDLMIADMMPAGSMPDLGTCEGQAALARMVRAMPDKPALLVLDNLSSLVGFKRNDPDGWNDVQRWLLALRHAGVAVLAVHHANKEGEQRGTSRREDILDVVMAVRRPADYSPRDGARFELHFEKARGLFADAVEPVEARLATDTAGLLRWHWRPVELGEFERAVALFREGFSAEQAAAELGVSRATGYRMRQRAVEMGVLRYGMWDTYKCS